MDKNVKKLWVEALRSGKYKQAIGRLRLGDAYCCMGVLCCVHAEKFNKWVNKNGYYAYFGADYILPEEVMNWAGLNTTNPKIDEDRPEKRSDGTCGACNDALKLNFNQIADLIEENL